ncbi:cell surface glycoprotein 1-like isoform X14 [Branchiostoma floridae]|uniref:Cell surface glycoprotein 1-like isoform X14 n=1 Tax=Branchiostoma floridae TaxID=7739 RepID=A0A9J7LEL8_BRAFL|nr:cell surface glycoprotein 1-like isoform X14 [Branchiostoma floridae]
MSAEGAVETKTEGEEAVVEAGAEAGAEAEAEVLVVTDGVVVLDGTEAGNTQDVKRKKFRPLKSIRKILGIKKGRKKSGDDPALLSAKPVSKSTGALLQVVETEPEEDVSNKTLANRSMSADSVFSPANGQTEPLRKGDMAASADNLNSQNFQSELSAKLKSRRSEDGASSEDECLPRSPDTIVTMADVINEHSTQNGMKRHSEESLESVGDEPGIAMAADQLAQGEKHQARQGTSVPAEFVSTGDVDLDAIPASPTHLSNQAALHKLSVAPKLRKASSRTRGVGKSPSPTPDLPIMSDSPRTDSLGKSPAEEPEQNDDGVMEDEAGGGEEEEEAGDSGASSSGEEHGPGSPPPSDLPDQPTPASPEAEDQDLITPKSPTRGPPNPLGQQLVEEMKRKQSVKKQDSFEEEEPPPEEPEEAVQEKEETAAEMEVPPAEEQDPAVATPETNQEEEQHGMYEDSHNSLQEDTHGAVQQVEEEEKEEAEEKVEDEPQDDLEETRQETVSSEDEAPPVEEEPPEEEEPEKETEKQNGPVEDETTPSEDDLEEYEEVVAKPPDVPVHNKRLSVAETRQMFARADPPAPETEAVIRPKLKPVPPKVEPSPSSSQPTKPVPIVPKTETPKETIVVKKPSSTPVVPSPMSPTASAAPQLRSLADKPQPKKVFGAIKALEDQGDDKIPAWVRIAQKKQKEREGGKDEDAAAVGGKKVVVVEKTPPAASSSQPPPKSPARKPSTGAVPPKVLVVEKTGSVTARPSAPRPSVGPTKPFSRPAEPPTPVIIPATKAPEQPKPLNSPTKPAESKPAVSTSPPPTKSGDLMANNNKLNRTGQFLARQQKKNFILPKPEKCIVCSENVYQTEMVKSDGRFFHKKCQRCLVCKRTLDISSFMVIQEKIYCKQHGQELKLAQQAV